ncbi:MAG: hypothetical protein IPN93_17615 [Bacteroidetes bacterium]|nr:hypothetical protein [Bacteroidota bacterium]
MDINGITHFNNNMLHYNNANGLAKYYSFQNIQGNVLPIEIREKIGEKTIDFYPWELSYVPANNLNWKPRTTLQSGSYSSWMDGESAKILPMKMALNLFYGICKTINTEAIWAITTIVLF